MPVRQYSQWPQKTERQAMTWSPGLNSVTCGADRLDDAGRLVAEDGGRRERVEAVDEVQVAVADAAGDGAHEHLAPDGLVDVDVLDRERLVGAVEHGGFHVVLLCWMVGAGRAGAV